MDEEDQSVNISQTDDSFQGKSSWQIFSLFINRPWLNFARLRLIPFLPNCIPPAIITMLASILILIAFCQSFGSQGHQEIDVTSLIVRLLGSVVILLIAWVISLWGYIKWLAVLTTFCNFWLDESEDFPTLASIKSAEIRAKEEVQRRKDFLRQFWFWTILFMIPVFAAQIALFVLSGVASFDWGSLIALSPIQIGCLICIVFLFLYLIIFSFLAIVVSAKTNLPPVSACAKVLKFFFAHFLESIVITVAVVALHCFVGELHFVDIFAPNTQRGGVFYLLLVFEQILQGAISIFLYPISLVPFCELLRQSLKQPN